MTAAARARLAQQLVAELGWRTDVPSWIVGRDPDGVAFEVVDGESETAVRFEGIGTMFISKVSGLVVVEAIALVNEGDPREVVQARHADLERRGRRLFGEDATFQHHDPLGVRTGSPTAVWS